MRLSDDMHPITGTNLKSAFLYACREVVKAWLAVAGGLVLVALFITIGSLIFTSKPPDFSVYSVGMSGAIFLCKICLFASLGYWALHFIAWFNNPPPMTCCEKIRQQEDDDWWWILNDDN